MKRQLEKRLSSHFTVGRFVFYFACLVFWGSTLALAAELLVRQIAPQKISGIVYDQRLGWRFKPNMEWRARKANSDEKTPVRFNSMGFRYPDYDLDKQVGVTRIMVLGDSFTAGVKIGDDSIFTTVLSHLLNGDAPGIEYEVMNNAVSAWSTDQQYIYLLQEGLAFQPDYIVVMIAPNDVRETYAKQLLRLDGQQLVSHGPSVSAPVQILWRFSNSSNLFQLAQRKANTSYGAFENIFEHIPVTFPVGDRFCDDKLLFLKNNPDELQQAENLFTRVLLEMSNLCRANDIGFAMSAIPTKMEYNASLDSTLHEVGRISDLEKRIAEQNGIPFLDLHAPLLRQEENPTSVFISSEYHLNEYGHAFVARELATFLRPLLSVGGS